jgi:low affinity Fe/Cu permease
MSNRPAARGAPIGGAARAMPAPNPSAKQAAVKSRHDGERAPSGHASGNGHTHALHGMHQYLEWFSGQVTNWAGSSWSFATAVALLLVWAICGPFFDFSENWQLVVNTGTTIITFLMVFLIQRAQNKESLAVQVKLNELLASQQGASNRLINVEDLTEDEIRDLHTRFSKLAERLERLADDCDPHSVSEATEVEEAERSLDKKSAPER